MFRWVCTSPFVACGEAVIATREGSCRGCTLTAPMRAEQSQTHEVELQVQSALEPLEAAQLAFYGVYLWNSSDPFCFYWYPQTAQCR